MDYFFSLYDRLAGHLHGLDMRDSYTNSIIKDVFLKYKIYKKYIFLYHMPSKQQKIHLHGVDMRDTYNYMVWTWEIHTFTWCGHERYIHLHSVDMRDTYIYMVWTWERYIHLHGVDMRETTYIYMVCTWERYIQWKCRMSFFKKSLIQSHMDFKNVEIYCDTRNDVNTLFIYIYN